MPNRCRFSSQQWTEAHRLAGCAWALDLAVALPAAVAIKRSYGRRTALRFLTGAGVTGLARHAFLHWLLQKTAREPISLGDPLSLARITCANVLAGLVMSGIRDRPGLAGRLAWSLALFGATALDWLDGPLARHSGATQHGATLDIEADSWLTLWTAIAATSWGELPRWVAVPPVVRYLHPLLDLRGGALPRGGRPGWGRVTGVAQMALLLAALAPVYRRPPRAIVTAVTAIVSGSQLISHLCQLIGRMPHGLQLPAPEGGLL